MNTSSIDLKKLTIQAKKYLRLLNEHAAFIVIVVVLAAYSFMVWRINALAAAEPSQASEDTAIAQTAIPRVDKQAIQNIQALEQNNTQLHALFDKARTNPFQE